MRKGFVELVRGVGEKVYPGGAALLERLLKKLTTYAVAPVAP